MTKSKTVAKKPIAKKPSMNGGNFHIEFKTDAQGLAWAAFKQHDILFLTGPAGTGKTFMACAFACEQILKKERSKIVLTRPIVEAGESLGFLPGTFEEKTNPYMLPMFDCMDALVGREGPWRERINQSIEVAPIAFMRGRSLKDAICIFDEAQNATMKQLKLFLTRLDENSKMIITGDPNQSDLPGDVALVNIMHQLADIPGIGIVQFKNNSIVRHPLVKKIVEKLGDI
jgi:phosphate starvation-inducible PhoH-like protein